MFRVVAFAASLLTLAGCVQAKVVVMKDPQSGAIIQCRTATSGASAFPIAQTMIDNSAAESCAEGYQAAGWRRMN